VDYERLTSFGIRPERHFSIRTSGRIIKVLLDMTHSEEEFLRVVEQVCAKAGLYIGRSEFYALVTYLEGYIRGLTEAGKLDSYPLGRLLPILEHEHGFSHASWGWWRHYLHDKKTDERAIKDFPEFLRRAMDLPIGDVERLAAARPSNYQLPDSPQTIKYDS